MEKFRFLAAVIAAHPNHTLAGRKRLQKTVMLLRRLGAPLDYDYSMHFYGPYSEGVQADVGLLMKLGIVDETLDEGSSCYELKADDVALSEADRSEIEPYQKAIDKMSKADAVLLELAATYDAFREMGSDRKRAMERLHRKKGSKCDGGRAEEALDLLHSIGLDED